MRKRRSSLVIIFLIFFLLSVIFFAIFGSRSGKAPTGIIEVVTSPFQGFFVNMTGVMGGVSQNQEIVFLREENLRLRVKDSEIKKIQREISALRDQFETTKIPSVKLLPAQIIGRRGFVPGVSVPEAIIINKGTIDNVKVGQVIIYKDVVLGQISKVSTHQASVRLLFDESSSLTAMTSNSSANGILKGKGKGKMLLENVVLSEKLEKEDSVVTKGDVVNSGTGFPPDLVIGKITSVDKKQSALFQTAEVKSQIDMAKIVEVFVIVEAL